MFTYMLRCTLPKLKSDPCFAICTWHLIHIIYVSLIKAIVKSRSRAADFFTLSQTRSVQRLQAIVKHFTSKFHSNNTA